MVLDEPDVAAFLDIYPMRPGHVLVVPRRHAVRVGELAEAEHTALFAAATRLGRSLRAALPCDDVNVVLNDGPAANQTVRHVHVHVIPRRRGDLGRLLGNRLVRPVAPLLGAPPRAELDALAARIGAEARAPRA